MTFLHGSLIAIGSLLMAVPIILHLTMRQRPKFAVFPALRFVQATLAQNQRRLQLRQWALLALRCLVIAAAAIALARPLLPPGAAGGSWLLSGSLFVWLLLVSVAGLVWLRGPSRWLTVGFVAILCLASLGLLAIVITAWAGGDARWLPRDQEAPTAAVFLIDNAPRLMYRQNNRSRLAAAQESAVELLRQLPPGSEIAVLTTGDRNAAFTTDTTSAAAAIRSLETAYVTTTLSDAIPRARSMLQEKEQERQELYIFTDMTAAAWQIPLASLSGESAGAEPGDDTPVDTAADDLPKTDVTIYVIDVGVEQPINLRLGPPRLPDPWNAMAGEFTLEVVVDAMGPVADQEVEMELWLEDPTTERPVIVDGKPSLPAATLSDRVRLMVPSEGSVTQRFQLKDLEEGLRHGRVEVRRSDPLPIDNVRYFTLASIAPERLLVAAGPDTYPQFVTEALAPFELRATGRARYECELIAAADLRDYALDRFAAVLLVDPPPLDDSVWRGLDTFVAEGGGLICLLGRNASPVTEFQSNAARKILPGRLARQWKAGTRPQSLAPRAANHPLLDVFRTRESAIPWDQSPIYRHWVFEDLAETANTVIRYRNGQPALLEMPRGRGIALTLTTPLSDPLNVAGRPAWNLLPTSSVPWPFLILLDRMVQHVVQQDSVRLNYLAGDTARVPARDAIDGSPVDVLTPAGVWEATTTQDGMISLGMLTRPGSYRLALADRTAMLGGVSVNVARDATDLTRLEQRKLDGLFGKGRYRYFDNSDQLTREVSDARVGQEGYPWVILAMALILAAEHLLSNRFYTT